MDDFSTINALALIVPHAISAIVGMAAAGVAVAIWRWRRKR